MARDTASLPIHIGSRGYFGSGLVPKLFALYLCEVEARHIRAVCCILYRIWLLQGGGLDRAVLITGF